MAAGGRLAREEIERPPDVARGRSLAGGGSLGLVATAGIYLVLAVFAVLALFPFYWLVVGSFKQSGEIFAYPPTLVPVAPTAANYAYLLESTAYARWFANTALVTAVQVVTSVFFCSLAGFGFAKY